MKKSVFLLGLILLLNSCTAIPPTVTAVPTPVQDVTSQTPKAPTNTVKLSLDWNKLKSSRIDLNLRVTNDTKVGIDFSKAIWTLNYAKQRGLIYQNDFDRVVIGPQSAREGVILFKFDKSFDKDQKFEITLENVYDLNGKLVPPMKLTGTFAYWTFTLDK